MRSLAVSIDMLSTVKPPKTKQELLNAIQKRNPLKFEVLEYSDTPSKSNISKALDNASKKGSFTVVIIE
jgi:hypothetical protein